MSKKNFNKSLDSKKSKEKRKVLFIGRPTRFKNKKAYDRKRNRKEIEENED